MSWATPQMLLTYTSDVLKVDSSALPESWSRQAGSAIKLAYANLIGYLARFGYSGAQLSSNFLQAVPWNLSQGLYELAGLGGGFGDYKADWFDRFDVITRLEKQKQFVLVASDGTPMIPDFAASGVGGIASGVNREVNNTLPPRWVPQDESCCGRTTDHACGVDPFA